MDRTDAKRWTKISLRTLHLLAVAGVGGGILFGVENSLWTSYWWLALVSGFLMMLMDMVSNPAWIFQVRGLSVVLKLVLLVLLFVIPAWDDFLLFVIIIISAVISHAPGKFRYYSIYHNKVMTSDSDSKG